MNAIEATLKVLIDGQAWLYATALLGDLPANIDQFEALQDEWKEQTAKLIQELIDE